MSAPNVAARQTNAFLLHALTITPCAYVPTYGLFFRISFARFAARVARARFFFFSAARTASRRSVSTPRAWPALLTLSGGGGGGGGGGGSVFYEEVF